MSYSHPPQIIFEQTGDLVILRVNGPVTFPQISDSLRQYFPCVTRHLIWDYTEGTLSNVEPADFKLVPDLARKHLTNREPGGRTAFACPSDFVYGMFRMYTAFADMRDMPYEYAVLRNFQEALEWVRGLREL